MSHYTFIGFDRPFGVVAFGNDRKVYIPYVQIACAFRDDSQVGITTLIPDCDSVVVHCQSAETADKLFDELVQQMNADAQLRLINGR